ncbi:chromatin assembly factor 1 protein, putative [Theileria annulata]|uniref:Chromatin assembly factor 1 protein, putative n=1 Tax=Theileria annulata TaxID=5874 RepID=Q4UG92_THEAN|nr:chromatin assembly factor 1 protein, putative [Theileria annulata]CAI73897.1 chromatin assembly factor 1 protein, putative [Theileria annulata]|eukprot:XP_954574.1 chromatin assembly factor 1 protein, putative [Theileria annulata]
MDERNNWIVNTRVLYDFISCIKLPQQPLSVEFTQTTVHQDYSDEISFQQIACGLQYETTDDVSIYIIDVALPSQPLKEELKRYCKCLDYEGFPLPTNTQFPMYQCVAQITLNNDVNRILSKTKDGNVLLAAKSTDVYLFNLNNLDYHQEVKNLEPICTLKGHQDEGYGLSFNSSCTNLASCSEDGLMFIYDLNKNEAVYNYKHSGGLNCVDYSKSNESNCFVATEDGYVLLIDTRQKTSHLKTRKVGGAENSVSTTVHNPNVFASGSTKGEIHLWDQRNISEPLHSISVHKGPIVRLHFNQLNKSLISSGSEDLTICVLDLESAGKDVDSTDYDEEDEEDDAPPELVFTHTGHQDKVYDFVWSKNQETENV